MIEKLADVVAETIILGVVFLSSLLVTGGACATFGKQKNDGEATPCCTSSVDGDSDRAFVSDAP